MNEITVTTNRITATGHSIGIWNWEVPVYLFLGGLAAGILILVSLVLLMKKEEKYGFTAFKMVGAVPVIMSIGMFALFLDLEHKLYVWRFYTAFRITSVMSWGSWILLLVYPFSLMLTLATVREGFPEIYDYIRERWGKGRLGGVLLSFIAYCEKKRNILAGVSLPVGMMLGIYTGILLSGFGARLFWNSAILGPLFLVSGASTGTALILLLTKDHAEKKFLTTIDLILIGFELLFIALYLIGMSTSTAYHAKAVSLIMGGELTHLFWIFVVIIGLALPAFFEIMELKGKQIPGALAAVMVLFGGLILRFVLVEAGQISGWLNY